MKEKKRERPAANRSVNKRGIERGRKETSGSKVQIHLKSAEEKLTFIGEVHEM